MYNFHKMIQSNLDFDSLHFKNSNMISNYESNSLAQQHKSLKSETFTPIHLKRKNKRDKIESLRKKKRNDKIIKLREESHNEFQNTLEESSTSDMMMEDYEKTSTSQIQGLITEFLNYTNINTHLEIIRKLRILVSAYKDLASKNVDTFFELKENQTFLHAFINSIKSSILDQENHVSSEFIYESLWFLTNIVGKKKYCNEVISSGCLECLKIIFTTIKHDSIRILDQAVWLLANIATEFPDDIIEYKFHFYLERILYNEIMKQSNEYWCSSLLNHTLWALGLIFKSSNIIDHVLEFEMIIQILMIAYFQSQDEDLLINIGLCLLEYTKKGDFVVDNIMKKFPNFLSRLLGIIFNICESFNSNTHSNTFLAKVYLKLLSSITSTTRLQLCQQLLENTQLLKSLHFLLSSREESIKREVTFSISNLLVGTQSQVDMIVYFEYCQESLLRKLIMTFWTSSNQVKKECLIAIYNALHCASIDTKKYLVHTKLIIPILIHVLKSENSNLIIRSLEALTIILEIGSQIEGFTNPFADLVENEDGDKVLENLRSKYDKAEIQKKVTFILSNYFDYQF